MPRYLLTIALILSATLVCSVASAQDPHSPKASADSHYQTAVRLFGEGRYREALDEFDQAIAMSPESIFYCNRAIVLIKLREPEAALENLETCQNTHTGSAADLAEIDAQRQAVATMVGIIRPGVIDTVSGINAPIAGTEEREGWTRTETGIVLLGIGGAALASAATLDFVSKDLKENLRTAARAPEGNREQYDALLQDYRTRQRIWIGLTAAGAAFTLTGAVFVVSRAIASRPADDVEVGITLDRPGAFVRFSW